MPAFLHIRKTDKAFLRNHWKEVVCVWLLFFAIVFFRSERSELRTIVPVLSDARPVWLYLGFAVTALYVFFQAAIYKKCFSALSLTISWNHAIMLFLRRNFISTFLPMGNISSLAYIPKEIRQSDQFSKWQLHQASGLFVLTGLVSVVLITLPLIVLNLFHGRGHAMSMLGPALTVVLICVLCIAIRSIQRRGKVYFWIKSLPLPTARMDELFNLNLQRSQVYKALAYSLAVEFCGIMHVWLAMRALGAPASFLTSALVYVVAVVMMVVSPFLKGLGLVEMSMVYVLQHLGFTALMALAITLIYRLFEFWLPLALGFLSFIWKGRHFILRAGPVLLCFLLGLVNIISVVSPPLQNRMRMLRAFIPVEVIHGSHLLVLFMGVCLLITSAFLFQGLRKAWILALSLSILSLLGHMIKGFDYEEATLAACTAMVLVVTSAEYCVRSELPWRRVGWVTLLSCFSCLLLFGFLSFLAIGQEHFGVTFNAQQSLRYTFTCLFLADDASLLPITTFGHEFPVILKTLAFLCWTFLFFILISGSRFRKPGEESDRKKAATLLHRYGSSSIDYYKICPDKTLFFSRLCEGFISYRAARGFAVVLGGPVCANEYETVLLKEFELHARRRGLKPVFYRVSEDAMASFTNLKKRKLLIGQEAIVQTDLFSLVGRERKSLRNGMNALTLRGYHVEVLKPPHAIELVPQLKIVSDEWLRFSKGNEQIFTQGRFDIQELKGQELIVLFDAFGQPKAFLNIIPDFAPDECTFDLIRKTIDAPGAATDALILKLISYAKENGKKFVNLGLVPMRTIMDPENLGERLLKLAADKMKPFKRFRGMQESKGKFVSFWEKKYLVYDYDFDLLRLPSALNAVIRPSFPPGKAGVRQTS